MPVRLRDALAAGLPDGLGPAVWRALSGRAQWRLLWLRHPQFVVGLTGAVHDDAGRVLLLRHRWWKDCPWGTPSGYLERGESLEAAFAREVREETGLELAEVHVVRVSAGLRLRIEVDLVARVAPESGPIRLQRSEILEARWFTLDALPEGLRRHHHELIHRSLPDGGPR